MRNETQLTKDEGILCLFTSATIYIVRQRFSKSPAGYFFRKMSSAQLNAADTVGNPMVLVRRMMEW